MFLDFSMVWVSFVLTLFDNNQSRVLSNVSAFWSQGARTHNDESCPDAFCWCEFGLLCWIHWGNQTTELKRCETDAFVHVGLDAHF